VEQHSHAGIRRRDPSHWNEIDPIGGITLKFLKELQLDVFWSAFQSQTDSYDTSNNLSVKLTWNDTIFGDSFSINPYVEFWDELSDKATVVFNPATSDESFYFAIGINPDLPVQEHSRSRSRCRRRLTFAIATSTSASMVPPGGSGLAVFTTQLKFQVPLNFIPKGYGAWTFYAGVQYYHLNNDGLLDGNQVLADAQRTENLVQFHGGISIFF
jgi:hypothetical protein